MGRSIVNTKYQISNVSKIGYIKAFFHFINAKLDLNQQQTLRRKTLRNEDNNAKYFVKQLMYYRLSLNRKCLFAA